MKLVSWNVNGIRSCLKKGFEDYFLTENADVFCLQETRAQQGDVNFDPGSLYKVFWSDGVRKGYSGTAIYSRYEPEEVAYGIGEPRFDSEGRFVIVKIRGLWIYNVYFPNGAANETRHVFKQDFLKLFGEHLHKKAARGERVVLLGDYNVAYKNIDVHDPVRLSKVSGFLPEERAWFEGFLSKGFVDAFRHFYPDRAGCYTWWSYRERARPRNRGWRIDHMCVTQNLLPHVLSAEVRTETHGSDHCPIVLNLED